MTLILSCSTHEYVVQVSDRRLTRNRVPVDDRANKAIMLTGEIIEMAFAYTGRAEVGNEGMDSWLAKVLYETSPHSLNNVVSAIETRTTEAFRRIRERPEYKRHAFVGVGWSRSSVDQSFQSTICEISNFRDEGGGWLDRPREHFTTRVVWLPETRAFDLEVTGQILDKDTRTTLERSLRRSIAKGVGPVPITLFLGNTIRWIAARNPTVGASLMVVNLPKKAMGKTSVMIHGKPAFLFPSSLPGLEKRSFLCISAEEGDATIESPIWVTKGSMGNIRYTPLPPGFKL